MRVHLCKPWDQSCGNVLRLYVHFGTHTLAVAFHRNATFGRENRWWWVA